jgi:hypothetical protein
MTREWLSELREMSPSDRRLAGTAPNGAVEFRCRGCGRSGWTLRASEDELMSMVVARLAAEHGHGICTGP